MKNLNGTKTHENLKAAFAGESQANRRYLYFANKADVEGQNDVAALFRSTAEGETGHAHGHLDYLAVVGDPATDLPIGPSRLNLKASVAGETHEYTDMYQAWRNRRARKASTKSAIGSRRWQSRALACQSFSKALDALSD
jgi:rubrerythrin